MTKPLETLRQALALVDEGQPLAVISRRLGVSRAAIRDWNDNRPERLEKAAAAAAHAAGNPCSLISGLPPAEYAYLLGQYLGDGCLSLMGPRGVYRLRIATCDDYPIIRAQCVAAINAVMPDNKVGMTQEEGYTEVWCFSKHWPCLFPQHGPGAKHSRRIELADWQLDMASAFPRELLAGLIHSDGCRCINRIYTKKTKKTYEYPRYFFTNESRDILNIFSATCDLLGIAHTYNRPNSISIAERTEVAYLDSFIGPKT